MDKKLSQRGTTVAKITDSHAKIKPEFQTRTCKKCGTPQRSLATWDIDIISMADKIGYPYDKLCFAAYSFPTSRIHATMKSADMGNSEQDRTRWKKQDAELALSTAFLLLTHIVRRQSEFFSLNLDEAEMDACENDVLEVCNTN